MRLLDMHSHWGTRRGYVLQTEEELARQKTTWNSEPSYDTEEEMADYLRRNGVRAILDFGFTKAMPLAQVREYHDYAIETQRRFPDAIFGNWLQIDPRTGAEGAAEMRRCIEASEGFIGCCVSGAGMGFPASDPIYDPFYELSVQTRRPVLVLVGYTGAGAGLPGGKGFKLDLCHPRHVDELAIRFPDLQIVTGRPAWPWQDEMIAVMLHKPNVWAELHGWSPKYLTEPLRRDVARRLSNRVMFGADYPLFRYERLVADWKSLGFSDEVLERVFHGNAERLFADVPHGPAAFAAAGAAR
jgi:predicted TIM-barrel fold metal-dependent hydrolase